MKTHIQKIINEKLDKCQKFNITFNNGTILKDVLLFTDKRLGVFAIYDLESYNDFISINTIGNTITDKKVNITIYFGNECVQGHFIPEHILSIEEIIK